MTFRELVKLRDRIFERLGWVKRPVEPPVTETSAAQIAEQLQAQSHEAQLRRIRGDG